MSTISREAGSGSEGGSAFKEGQSYLDVEQQPVGTDTHLQNTTVQNFSWRGVSVTVKDRETKQPKVIVDNVEGHVEAGESSFLSPLCFPCFLQAMITVFMTDLYPSFIMYLDSVLEAT